MKKSFELYTSLTLVNSEKFILTGNHASYLEKVAIDYLVMKGLEIYGMAPPFNILNRQKIFGPYIIDSGKGNQLKKMKKNIYCIVA